MNVENFYGKTIERRVSCFGQGTEAILSRAFVLFQNFLHSAISSADNTIE